MSGARPLSRRSVVSAAIATLATGGLSSLALAQPAAAASSQGGSISRSETISRAKNWYDRNVQYNQGASSVDVDGAHYYRQDCSGFVSMAWHLTSSRTTATLPAVCSTISMGSLKPGDALNNNINGHCVLFVKWLDQDAGHFAFYQESNPTLDMEYGTAYTGSGNIAGWPHGNYTALRYDKIVDDAPPPPPKQWKLQTVVHTTANVYHAVRSPSGSWTNFGNVEGQSGSIGNIKSIADAGISDDTHVLAINSSDDLYHAIRYGDGSWSPFRNVEHVAGTLSGITDVGAVSIGDSLHVATVANGRIYHTIRHDDGTWDDWGGVYAKTGDAGVAVAVAVASVAGELQMAVAVPGTVRHAIRHADGTWTQWGNTENQAGDSGDPTGLAIAGVNGEAQLIVISNGGTKYVHTIRHSDGSWEPYRSLAVTLGTGHTIVSVGAARVDDELQATFVSNAGNLFHTIRHSDGSWIDANTKALTGVSGTIIGTADTGTLG